MDCNAASQHALQAMAHTLSAWWTRPVEERVALWRRTDYRRQVIELWREMGEANPACVQQLLSCAGSERADLATEYERLFVGPAAVPCAPYEAVWREDRPRHELGTVMGRSTSEVTKIYRELGLRLRPSEVELADHIAIELEALSFALGCSDPRPAEGMVERLRAWLPRFCTAVTRSSCLQFYRLLAAVTVKCFVKDGAFTVLGAAVDQTEK